MTSNALPIRRIGPTRLSPTRGRSVIYNGVVTTVATSETKEPSLYSQARNALAMIDRNLIEAGTDKSRILTAMVYITDMRNKPELNRAWDAWVDRANLPMRACLGVELEGDDLVEIVVTAALSESPASPP
jgi:enamine deaminase RidA (YjgF/YER057c/UK114 family)